MLKFLISFCLLLIWASAIGQYYEVWKDFDIPCKRCSAIDTCIVDSNKHGYNVVCGTLKHSKWEGERIERNVYFHYCDTIDFSTSLISIVNYKNGELDGRYVEFGSKRPKADDWIRCKGYFKEGKQVGVWTILGYEDSIKYNKDTGITTKFIGADSTYCFKEEKTKKGFNHYVYYDSSFVVREIKKFENYKLDTKGWHVHGADKHGMVQRTRAIGTWEFFDVKGKLIRKETKDEKRVSID